MSDGGGGSGKGGGGDSYDGGDTSVAGGPGGTNDYPGTGASIDTYQQYYPQYFASSDAPPSYEAPPSYGGSSSDTGGFTPPQTDTAFGSGDVPSLDNIVQSGGGTPPASDGGAPSLDNLVQNSGGLGGLTKDFGDSGGNPRAYAGVTSSGDSQLGSFNNDSTGILLPGAVTSEFSARSEAPAGAGVGGFTAPAGVGGGAGADPTSDFNVDNALLRDEDFKQAENLWGTTQNTKIPGAVDWPDSYTGDRNIATNGGNKPLGMDDGVPLPPERPATGLNLDYPGSDSSAKSKGGGFSNSDDKNSGGILSQLGVKNPLQTAIAGAGLLYSMSQGNKTAGGENAAALKSSISQVQGVIDQANKLSQQFTETAKNIRAGVPDLLTSANKTQEGVQPLINSAREIQAGAGPLTETGQRLMSYVSTGILPPELQKQVDAGAAAAKARVISNYSSRGMNTDPTQNTSLAQELNGIDNESIILGGKLAQQLFTSGTQAINAATQVTSSANQTISAANQTQQTADQTRGVANQTNQVANQADNSAAGLIDAGLKGISLDQKTYNDLIALDQHNSAATSNAIANFAKALGGAGSNTQTKTT